MLHNRFVRPTNSIKQIIFNYEVLIAFVSKLLTMVFGN